MELRSNMNEGYRKIDLFKHYCSKGKICKAYWIPLFIKPTCCISSLIKLKSQLLHQTLQLF